MTYFVLQIWGDDFFVSATIDTNYGVSMELQKNSHFGSLINFTLLLDTKVNQLLKKSYGFEKWVE